VHQFGTLARAWPGPDKNEVVWSPGKRVNGLGHTVVPGLPWMARGGLVGLVPRAMAQDASIVSALRLSGDAKDT